MLVFTRIGTYLATKNHHAHTLMRTQRMPIFVDKTVVVNRGSPLAEMLLASEKVPGLT